MFRTMFLKLIVLSTLTLVLPARAHAVLHDFEALTDSDFLSNQISGLTFSNATVLTAGISLNDTEFPPNSGENVVVDSGGAIVIDFASLISSVAAYFTYTTSISVEAFDSGLASLGIIGSAFSSNQAASGEVGSSPNELLQIASAAGIRRIVITGSAQGESFVMDDLTYELRQVNPVPEPGTVSLVALIVAALCARRRGGR